LPEESLSTDKYLPKSLCFRTSGPFLFCIYFMGVKARPDRGSYLFWPGKQERARPVAGCAQEELFSLSLTLPLGEARKQDLGCFFLLDWTLCSLQAEVMCSSLSSAFSTTCTK
jgi:hypothetical protein